MANTSSRTLRLLSLLQTHRFWPGAELAGRLEVSERTLRRDIERLRDLGYPVDSAAGSRAATSWRPAPRCRRWWSTRTRRSRWSSRWATGASAVGRAGRGVAVGAVQGGPGAAGPAAASGRVAASGDGGLAVLPGARGVASVLGGLPKPSATGAGPVLLHRPWWPRARGGLAPARRATPTGDVGRRWYLLGYDLDREDWRSFRLDRIGSRGTKSMFRRREIPGGDAAAYVRNGVSRRDRELRFTVAVTATEEHVRATDRPVGTGRRGRG